MDWDGVLVRFGEIGIKSQPVRRRMIDKLRQNLLDSLLRHGVEGDVHVAGSRLWLVGPDANALLSSATQTFGVVSASPVKKCSSKLDDMAAIGIAIAMEDDDWESFAVKAKRDGEHEYSSPQAAGHVGGAIQEAAQAAGRAGTVNLGDPDLAVHLDIRGDKAYVFTRAVPGPGGLPMGSQGKVVALISDPASCVAAWLMMRRGCSVVPVHAGQAQSLPMDNLSVLQAWGLQKDVDLLPICTGFVSKEVLLGAAAELARRTNSAAIVTGETLASTLLHPDGVPVLRPVCGLALSVVADLQARIGLIDEEPEHILLDDARETVETALSMHRVVEA